MIPITLKLKAFGPFVSEESIDFSKFNNEKLFLIYGNTGSGKTTIFDAITFALFGKPSGDIRDSSEFKSQFVDDSTVCFVEFSFMIRNQLYTIYREPNQNKVKRNGNIVKENSVATLTFENGGIINGANEVTYKIEEILGLNVEQFKKVVMLPQGEFKKFLLDESSEKQKILRNIFSTEILDSFTNRLFENAKNIKDTFNLEVVKINTHINSIICDENSELSSLIGTSEYDYNTILEKLDLENQADKKQLQALSHKLNTIINEISKINLPLAEETNKNFDELEAIQTEFIKLNEKANFYTELEKNITVLKVIKDALLYENEIISNTNYIKELAEKIFNTTTEVENSKKLLAENSSLLQTATKNKDSIPEIITKIEKIKFQIESLNNIKTLKDKTYEVQNLISQNEATLKALSYEKECFTATEYYNALNSKTDLIVSLENKISDYLVLHNQHADLVNEYENAFSLLLKTQAFNLSLKLKDGIPCPVCGSTEHPTLSKRPENSITEDELQKIKERYDNSLKEIEKYQADIKNEIKELGYTNDIFDTDKISNFLSDTKTICLNEISNIQNVDLNITKKYNSITEITDSISKTNTNISVLNEQKDNLNKQISVLEANCNYADIVSASTEKQLLEKQIESYNKEFERIKQEDIRLNNTILVCNEKILQLKNQTEEHNKNLDSYSEKFNQILAGHNISHDEYDKNKGNIKFIEEYENDIRSYRNELEKAKSKIEYLTTATNEKSRYDLESLNASYSDYSKQKDETDLIITNLTIKLKTNTEILKKITFSIKELADIEKKQNDYQYLYDVANGKYSEKMNFERYVLATYFDMIIAHANIRLLHMTNSRYQLHRRTDKEKGNKTSGLQLEVFDSNTGKYRHVNSISGGESFKVALCLALGLADIISNTAGSIEINTLFIDEGFGSLDDNSLESAIECLEDLKSQGRYIGIISHVSALKEKIHSKISVEQSTVGSKIIISED